VFTVLALAGGFAAETRMTRRRARMIAARAARLRPRSPTPWRTPRRAKPISVGSADGRPW